MRYVIVDKYVTPAGKISHWVVTKILKKRVRTGQYVHSDEWLTYASKDEAVAVAKELNAKHDGGFSVVRFERALALTSQNQF